MKISSYISIFDDWDLLKPSLWSIDALVDERVLIDGAYGWMAPYFKTVARDPVRSRDEVYDILSSFGRKVRVVNGLWRNETHKRQAGFEACNGRYVLRNDADEVLFWVEAKFEEFVQSGRAVGQMEMPIYVCPGQIRASSPTSQIERQSFLFDKDKITAWQHLSYLWLVLPPEEAKTLEPAERNLVFPDPIAFTAHITHWRSPETAVNRARFYVMNFVRSTGTLPWLKDFKYTAEDGFDGLFKAISPNDFDDILLGHEIVAGPPRFNGDVIRPSGRPVLADRVFAILYDNMLSALARLNDDLRIRPRAIVNGVKYLIDASANRSLAKLQNGTNVRLRFSESIVNAQVEISEFFFDGVTTSRDISVDVDGHEISFDIPRLEASESSMIRRTIGLTARFAQGIVLAKFQAGDRS